MSGPELITIIFRWVNGAVLVWFGYRVFNKYVYHALVQAREEERRRGERLAEERDSLARRYEEAVHLMSDEQNAFARVEKQVMQWATIIEHKRHARAEEKQTRVRQLEQKKIQCEENFKMERLRDEVMPQALEEAKKTLLTRYAQGSGKSFVNDILTFIEQKKI
jgi:hypothetical protein